MTTLDPEGLEKAAEATYIAHTQGWAGAKEAWGNLPESSFLRGEWETIARAAVSAYLEAQVVANVKELDALPVGSAVLGSGDEPYIRTRLGWATSDGRVWLTTGWDYPMRVLYTPTP